MKKTQDIEKFVLFQAKPILQNLFLCNLQISSGKLQCF